MAKNLLRLVTTGLLMGIVLAINGCERQPDKERKTDAFAEGNTERKRKAEEPINDDVKTIVKKAVASHGGPEAIDQLDLAQVTYRIQGVFPNLPIMKNLDISVKETYQLPQRIKKEIRGKGDDMEFDISWVAEEEKYWFWEKGKGLQSFNKKTDVVGQYRPFIVLDALANYESLKWSFVEEVSEKRPGTVAVRFQLERDFGNILYFDKETGLLTGNKYRQSIRLLDKEAWMESELSDFREINGLKLFHKAIGFIDGKRSSEITIQDVRFFDKLDDRVFDPPME